MADQNIFRYEDKYSSGEIENWCGNSFYTRISPSGSNVYAVLESYEDGDVISVQARCPNLDVHIDLSISQAEDLARMIVGKIAQSATDRERKLQQRIAELEEQLAANK